MNVYIYFAGKCFLLVFLVVFLLYDDLILILLNPNVLFIVCCEI